MGKLDKTSSGSIDNFQHLFKKTLSQEKLGETKSRFERGFNRLSSRFKMPKKLESFVKSSKTCSNEKPLSKPPSTPPPPSHEKSNTKKSRKTHKTITLKLTVCSLYINTHFGFTSIKNPYSILSRPDYYVLFS